MAQFKLYFFPGTSSRVAMIALEETRQPYETQLVALPRGEHKSPDYLQLNPKGKVPTLLVDGQPLTETLAILNYLNARFPEAGLLPTDTDPFKNALIQADLAWFNSTLQPLVTGNVLPQVFCAQPETGTAQTKLQYAQLITPHMQLLEQRLSKQPYFLGERWSMFDAFAWWVWDQILFGGFAGHAFPALAAHAERVTARPSVQRALAQEAAAFGHMAARGIHLGPLPSAKSP